MENLMTLIASCGRSNCYGGWFFFSSSRANQIAVLFMDSILVAITLSSLACKRPPPSKIRGWASPLVKLSVVFNLCVGLAYLGFGFWALDRGIQEWLVPLVQGFTWLVVTLVFNFWSRRIKKLFLELLTVSACLLGGFLCVGSVLDAVYGGVAPPARAALGILTLPGALLLLICCAVFTGSQGPEASSLVSPLLEDAEDGRTNSTVYLTPLSDAGFLSKMTFWWLNPLIKKGNERPLEEDDMPRLRREDRAETRYALMTVHINEKKPKPCLLRALFYCHRREILLSGLFAFLKVLTLAAGPLFLNAFIQVSEGEEAFPYEGYVLAATMFFSKCLESLSQRQWYFRSRLVGLQVRSILSAAIYRKQLRLSNAAKLAHSSGEIMSYLTVDAYRVGEFPFWLHQTWTTSLQLVLALVIVYQAVGLATVSAMAVIVLTVLCNAPLAKLQHKFQSKLMEAQDERLKAMAEALVNMKVLKLYAWETHFKRVIEGLRKAEEGWLYKFLMRKAYNSFLFWSSPILVAAATFATCYLLRVPLEASNVFTFVATLRIVQEPVRLIPDVIAVVIQAQVAFARVEEFLDAPELQSDQVSKVAEDSETPIVVKSAAFSWEMNSKRPTLKNLSMKVKRGEKVAICGEVGSGKSTLLAAILGEIPRIEGSVQVCGKIAYVSQAAWIQTGSIRDNILFGSAMDERRFQETLERCSLVRDLELLPFGDLTEIGERGVNLSGGQKQRIQLARALYQDADIYLLDDPFSAVDAHTATSLFHEYVMGGLCGKTVLLVTHQVDFLPAFDSILLMSDGEILRAASYADLLASRKEFREPVDGHKETAAPEKMEELTPPGRPKSSSREIDDSYAVKEKKGMCGSAGDQLIKKEERERGDTGLKPYLLYLGQHKGFFNYAFGGLMHVSFIVGQLLQNTWMAAKVDSQVSTLKLITVYLLIGIVTTIFLLFRSVSMVFLGLQSSESLFSQLLASLFRAPMSFFDSTPAGRILSRVSSDLSITDIDVPFSLMFSLSATLNSYSQLGVLAVITWQVLFVSVPMVYLTLRIQRYYLTVAKELMRLNGTTKSLVANLLAESLSGAMTIRAFDKEDGFVARGMELLDKNASPFFHNFAASEWLIQRVEIMTAAVMSSSALVMSVLPHGTFSSGFIGMALSYGLSLNNSLVFSTQNQCMTANFIVSVERLNQYMHVDSEAPEVLENNRAPADWPRTGKVEFQNLKIRYRGDAPLVLRGISCSIEGGHKIGIVGRTGSGKSTLISALFRLVEPAGGRIIVDGVDIGTLGLHDLRSRFAVIPQEPTLFQGSVRYNLDPLSRHTDEEIWKILDKCHLRDAVQEKGQGLDSPVVEDGSNWSMGQKQLFCLGRALLRKSRILVLDEATASIDNATDAILQKTIRIEFATSTVITVAHRIPTIMDCTRVLVISDGNMVEYDSPADLMMKEGSHFSELVKEYWSRTSDATGLTLDSH